MITQQLSFMDFMPGDSPQEQTEQTPTQDTKTKYYDISEEIAERAWYAIHMGDYKKNSTTESYRASVDAAAELAENQKKKVSSFYHEKINHLLDKYARRLAEWQNAYNRNQASCPSMFITGAGNYPYRKHEKKMNREGRLWEEYNEIKGILDKIKKVGTGSIDLTDPNAREMLQERLESLQNKLELDKRLNAYWRKHKTFEGCPDLSAEKATKLTAEFTDTMNRCAWVTKPYPDYELTSLRDKIKRTQERIEQLNILEQKQNDGDGKEKFDGGEIVRNYEENRLQILFDDKPDEDMRTKLKSNGFKWSPRNKAWQRQLTRNAEYALERLALS